MLMHQPVSQADGFAEPNQDVTHVLGEFDYAKLDPGIRNIVRVLRYLGFNTVSSGDGETKLESGYDPAEIVPYPHVAISVDPEKLLKEAYRLTSAIGESWTIQATFNPRDETALILVMNLPKD